MEEEKRDDRSGDPIKSLLEEALERQRNEMMDSFTQILLRMPAAANASSTSSRFGDATPFKVQVNFDIPLFEGEIDVDSLDNWLNVLKGISLSTIYSMGKRSPFLSLRQSPISKTGGVLIGRKTHQTSLECWRQIPLGTLS